MLEVSHSSISMAKSCPMRYKWRYIEGYKPIRKSTALGLGSLVHTAFDMFYNRFSDEEVTDFISETMDEQITNSSLTEQEDLQIVKNTALGMWKNFPYKDLSEFSEIVSEKEFKIPLTYPLTNKNNIIIATCNPLNFVGKSDRLVKKDGKWWVGELKTSGLAFSIFKNKMAVSDQVTAYVYAWRKLGYPVQGVIFDYIRKPLLRKNVSEDCMGFSQRIMNDYKVNAKGYFGRHFEYRNEVVLNHWERDMQDTIKMIERIWKGECYRNTDACFLYNSECPYLKICFAEKPDPLTVELYYERLSKRNDMV